MFLMYKSKKWKTKEHRLVQPLIITETFFAKKSNIGKSKREREREREREIILGRK